MLIYSKLHSKSCDNLDKLSKTSVFTAIIRFASVSRSVAYFMEFKNFIPIIFLTEYSVREEALFLFILRKGRTRSEGNGNPIWNFLKVGRADAKRQWSLGFTPRERKSVARSPNASETSRICSSVCTIVHSSNWLFTDWFYYSLTRWAFVFNTIIHLHYGFHLRGNSVVIYNDSKYMTTN